MRAMRIAVQLVLAILGVVSIIATGGGGSGASACFVIDCGNPFAPPTGPGSPGTPETPGTPGPPTTLSISISPTRQTVQVGMPITITATTNMLAPTYSWCRVPPGGSDCTSMPEATGSQYTIPAVRLADDGTRFKARVDSAVGWVASAYSELWVSSLPAVGFADGDFLDGDWQTTTVLSPAVGGPRVTASHQGGGPLSADWAMAFDMPAAGGTALGIFVRTPSLYDPTSQGAIRFIDFRATCQQRTTLASGVTITPALEQDGRRFVADAPLPCEQGFLASTRQGVQASNFSLADGPSCPANAACPDFSAKAAPIRPGFAVSVVRPSATEARQIRVEVDDWSVTVWRP